MYMLGKNPFDVGGLLFIMLSTTTFFKIISKLLGKFCTFVDLGNLNEIKSLYLGPKLTLKKFLGLDTYVVKKLQGATNSSNKSTFFL